jgi:hypothetical protein
MTTNNNNDKPTTQQHKGVRRNASLNKMIQNIEKDNPEFIDNPELIFLPTLRDIIKVEYLDKDGKPVKNAKKKK